MKNRFSPSHLIQAVFGFFIAIVASWCVAAFWQHHGEWWYANFPKTAVLGTYAMLRPFLSDEAWQAEEQLDFLIFWIPSLLLMAGIALSITICRRKPNPAAGQGKLLEK